MRGHLRVTDRDLLPLHARYNFAPGDIATDCLMRHAIALATLFALTLTAANAAEWCGFVDKENAPVRCGYSSLSECKQSLTNKKDGYCIPDPGFASRGSGKVKVASRIGE